MDPISVAASIVGLLTAAAKISSTMQGFVSITGAANLCQRVQHEIRDITAAATQLQTFVLEGLQPMPSRKSMVDVNQVLITLTGTVCTFSELEKEVDGLKRDSDMGILDRAKWAWKEQAITQLCQRIQDHKLSLSLMLTILTCRSSTQAKSSMDTLCSLVGELIESNTNMSNRLRMLESRMSGPQNRSVDDDFGSIKTTTSRRRLHDSRRLSLPRLDFEDALFATRVYENTLFRNSIESLTSSRPRTAQWSVLSRLSLADISNLSVLSLPLSASELYNPRWYDKEQRTIRGSATTKPQWLDQEPRRYRSILLKTAFQSTNGYHPKARNETDKRREGFSDLVGSVFRTPPKISISLPFDPVHVSHVGYNYRTGEFTACSSCPFIPLDANTTQCLPRAWQRTLEEAGMSEKEQKENPQAVLDVMAAYAKNTEIRGVDLTTFIPFPTLPHDKKFSHPLRSMPVTTVE
ncbi:MAG: hypothetical protein M1840_001499 [Geoglossum simile]|nr:MAG: hypothetical protein M1840_001499 [Geoglossum simile]